PMGRLPGGKGQMLRVLTGTQRGLAGRLGLEEELVDALGSAGAAELERIFRWCERSRSCGLIHATIVRRGRRLSETRQSAGKLPVHKKPASAYALEPAHLM